MSAHKRGGLGSKPDLLELWMGEPADGPRPPSGARRAATVTLAAGAIAAGVVLAKYAIDVLVIVLALLAAGVVLRAIERRLSGSDLLSPGWLVAIGLGLVLFSYAVTAPSGAFGALARRLPKPVSDFLEWSENRGWAGRAFGGGGSAPAALDPDRAASVPSAPAARFDARTATGALPSSGAPIVLSASRVSSVVGRPITLTARLAEGSQGSEVRFYDGSTLLGAGAVRTEGAAWIAELTVVTLGPGAHEITAEVGHAFAPGTMRSEPVRLSVR